MIPGRLRSPVEFANWNYFVSASVQLWPRKRLRLRPCAKRGRTLMRWSPWLRHHLLTKVSGPLLLLDAEPETRREYSLHAAAWSGRSAKPYHAREPAHQLADEGWISAALSGRHG